MSQILMARRRYDMGARSDAVADTTERILAAAMELHAEAGVQATRWEEIATQAGVSVATMYRHFPSLKELVPACASVIFDLIAPLSIEQALLKYEQLDGPSERLDFLVRAQVRCYDRGQDWLHTAYRERDFIPELDAALRTIQDSLRSLVQAAVRRPLGKVEAATLFTLLDFPFYGALRRAGLDQRAAERVLRRLVLDAEEDNRGSMSR